MFLVSLLLIVGIAVQVVAWHVYRRDYGKFWVCRPIWYFLHPKGVALFVIGTWAVLAGLVLYVKGYSYFPNLVT